MATVTAGAAPRWRLFPHVIFCRTGFPYELLERLRFGETVRAFRRLQESDSALERLQAELLRDALRAEVSRAMAAHAAPPVLKSLSVARGRIARTRSVPAEAVAMLQSAGYSTAATRLDSWNLLLAERQRETDRARAVFETELHERGGALRAVAADRRFQEAVFGSNPALYPGPIHRYLERWRADERPADTRRFERRLISYLQRGVAKTDGAGLFGPIDFAYLDASESQSMVAEHPSSGMISAREVFLAFWAVEAISEQLSRDPEVRPYLRPRFSPLCELRDPRRVYVHLLDAEQPVDALQAAAIPMADGRATVATIAARLGERVPEVLATLADLAERGIVFLRIEVPSTIFHPFNWLVEFVRALPTDCATRDTWLAALLALEAARGAFRDGELDERVEHLVELERRFTALTGQPARRRPGEAYADRTIVYEDCRASTSHCRFGAPILADLEQRLGVALDVCVAYGWLYRAHCQWMARVAYQALAANGAPVPFSRFVNQLQAMGQAGQFPPRSAAMSRFERAWTERVAERARGFNGRVAPLTREDVHEIVSLAPPSKRNAHAAPDLLLSARDEASLQRGDYQIIVGEVGENVYVWGSQFYFHERRAETERQIAALFASLPEYHPFAFILPRRPHKGLLNESFAGTIIDAFACTTRPPGTTVPFRDLRVVPCGDELALVTADGRRFQFFHHHDELVHLWAFAPPRIIIPRLLLDSHWPRVEVDGIVLQREQWRLAVGALVPLERDDFARFRRVWAAKQRLGLPDQVFVHVVSEAKPFCIDFTSFLSVELLAHVVREQQEILVVEMLPTAEGLWFQDEGGRYCTEFRALAYRT